MQMNSPMRFNPNKSIYIIGEAGSNHLGSLPLAINLIEEVGEAGADAVKFQLFRLEDILIDPSKGEKWWELPVEWLPTLADAARKAKVDFLCTPFAPWAVWALNPYVPLWKIGSFEHSHKALWDAVRLTGKKVIASTGRWNGLTGRADYLLYCISKYPALPSDVNLSRIREWGYHGFSDHTLSITLPAYAVAAGARIIEKHVHYGQQPGGRDLEESPDYPHSLNIFAFEDMVIHIREAETVCHQPSFYSNPPPLATFPNRKEVGHDSPPTPLLPESGSSHSRDQSSPLGIPISSPSPSSERECLTSTSPSSLSTGERPPIYGRGLMVPPTASPSIDLKKEWIQGEL